MPSNDVTDSSTCAQRPRVSVDVAGARHCRLTATPLLVMMRMLPSGFMASRNSFTLGTFTAALRARRRVS